MTNTVVASKVAEEITLTIPADGAMVVVEVPAGSVIDHEGLNYYVEGCYISTDRSTLHIEGPDNNDIVSGKFELEAILNSNFEDEIDYVTLTIDDEPFQFADKITVNVNDFSEGSKQLKIEAVTKSGLTDEITLRLTFE